MTDPAALIGMFEVREPVQPIPMCAFRGKRGVNGKLVVMFSPLLPVW